MNDYHVSSLKQPFLNILVYLGLSGLTKSSAIVIGNFVSQLTFKGLSHG